MSKNENRLIQFEGSGSHHSSKMVKFLVITIVANKPRKLLSDKLRPKFYSKFTDFATNTRFKQLSKLNLASYMVEAISYIVQYMISRTFWHQQSQAYEDFAGVKESLRKSILGTQPNVFGRP